MYGSGREELSHHLGFETVELPYEEFSRENLAYDDDDVYHQKETNQSVIVEKTEYNPLLGWILKKGFWLAKKANG